MKLTDAQRYYMHTSYSEFHPDLIMIAGSVEKYRFTRSMAFTKPTFTKLTDAQRYYMHASYTEFHPDLIMVAGSMEMYQFTTLCEVWLSLH